MTLPLNCFVVEVSAQPNDAVSFHFLSLFGNDQEIGAIAAASAEDHPFRVMAHGAEFAGALGGKPILYRGSLPIPGRKRPLRHLIAISQEFFATTLAAQAEASRTILFDHSPQFLLYRLSVRFGLPVLPEWAGWFQAELVRRRMVEELIGLNCSPVLVKGTKLELLDLLSEGLRRHVIQIP